jgi:outer membrane protein assembly factor BamB
MTLPPSILLRRDRLLRGTAGLAAVCLICIASRAPLFAQRLSWPDKSGPTFNGHVAAEDAKDLPTAWDEATGRNIAWKVKLEGEGHSTPIIGQGRLWLTAAAHDGTKQYVYCLDANTGRVLHHKLLFENEKPEPLGNVVNNYAAPSCVLEADAVYVHFGTYGTARLDPRTAEIIWQRRDINCRHFRGPGSSPVLFEGLLILTCDGIDQQFVTALDKATGKTVWRTDRSTNYRDAGPDGKPIADGDLRKAYGTPSLVKVDGRWQLISVGSRAGFGYDARTGKEIWTIEHPDFNSSARPLFFQDTVIVGTGSAAHLIAVRLDATTRGNVTKSHVAWTRTRGNGKLPAPVLVGERIFQVTDGGVANCIEAATGKELWSKRLGDKFTASPIVAGEAIYFCDEHGNAHVVKAQDTFEAIGQNVLKEGMRASPAAADGAIYLRTFGHLYKIAQKR